MSWDLVLLILFSLVILFIVVSIRRPTEDREDVSHPEIVSLWEDHELVRLSPQVGRKMIELDELEYVEFSLDLFLRVGSDRALSSIEFEVDQFFIDFESQSIFFL